MQNEAKKSKVNENELKNKQGDLLDFFPMCCIQHCFIRRPSDYLCL
jgi:hypothetical protein